MLQELEGSHGEPSIPGSAPSWRATVEQGGGCAAHS